MKAFYLLVLAALGYVAYTQIKEPRNAPAAPSAPPVAEASAAALAPDRTAWQRSEFYEVRGHVVAVVPEGLLVSIDPTAEEKVGHLNTGEGAAAAARYSAIVEMQDRREFGPTMIMDHGALRETTGSSSNKAQGTVFIRAHPRQASLFEGSTVKVIAAPLDNPFAFQGRLYRAFTMNYVVPPEPFHGSNSLNQHR